MANRLTLPVTIRKKMKTVFDSATRDELVHRIGTLTGQSRAQWGKMDVYQMVRHCALWEEMALGKKQYGRMFIGRIFGRMVLKLVVKDDSPLGRSTPTLPEFVVTDHGDVTAAQERWIALIKEYASFTNDRFVHPFFGEMTREQTGIMAYKHADHHLRQFNS